MDDQSAMRRPERALQDRGLYFGEGNLSAYKGYLAAV